MGDVEDVDGRRKGETSRLRWFLMLDLQQEPMNRHALFTLVLALFILLSGCNGLTDVSPPGTPAPVPPDEAGHPPGVDDSDVYSPKQLATAHYDELTERSYTREENWTSRLDNGTVRAHHRTVGRATGWEGDFHSITTYAPPREHPIAVSDIASPVRSEMYVEGDRLYYRVVNRTVTRTGSIPRPPGDSPRLLTFYLQSFDLQVANHTERDGTTSTVLKSTNLTDPFFLHRAESLPSEAEVQKGRFRAVVDSSGLVHEYEVRYTAVLSEDAGPMPETEVVWVRTSVRFSNLGTTTVSRPEWYDHASEGG